MSEIPETELLAQARGGDRAALGELLLQKYDALSRMIAPKIPELMRRTISVDDVLQQAFADVYRSLDRFEYRGEGSFLAWLRTICEHRLRDLIKAQTTQKRGGEFQAQAQAPGADSSAVDFVNMLTGGMTSPSRAMSRKEAVRALNVAINALSEDYQQVIRLRFLQGKSIEETAAEVGKTPNAVRAIANRAKKELRDALGRMSNYITGD